MHVGHQLPENRWSEEAWRDTPCNVLFRLRDSSPTSFADPVCETRSECAHFHGRNRIVFNDVIVQTLRQQAGLASVPTFDESLQTIILAGYSDQILSHLNVFTLFHEVLITVFRGVPVRGTSEREPQLGTTGRFGRRPRDRNDPG